MTNSRDTIDKLAKALEQTMMTNSRDTIDKLWPSTWGECAKCSAKYFTK